MFKALYLEKDGAATRASVKQLDDAALSPGDVTVDVEYSTINYKDALAITGKAPIVRTFPMVPGIDLAGRVSASSDARFKPGDAVLLNGWGYGESAWGGLAQKARIAADKLMHLPKGMSAKSAMSIGTAGYTAALSVLALARHGVKPGDGEVLVTGANGGVGSFAIALLSRRGYRVVASTGRPEEGPRLQRLGAGEVISRESLSQPGKPLQKERWAGVVDSVGSHTLANACAQSRYRGVVTACGLAQGMDFPASVAPFILRGVTLVGIESVMAPMHERLEAWTALGESLDEPLIGSLAREIGLDQAVEAAHDLLEGRIAGRVVVNTR